MRPWDHVPSVALPLSTAHSQTFLTMHLLSSPTPTPRVFIPEVYVPLLSFSVCPEEKDSLWKDSLWLCASKMFCRLSDFGELFNSLLIHKRLSSLDNNENFVCQWIKVSLGVFVSPGVLSTLTPFYSRIYASIHQCHCSARGEMLIISFTWRISLPSDDQAQLLSVFSR